MDTQDNLETDLVKSHEVPNQQIAIVFKNDDAVQRYVYIDIYLIA